MAEKSVRPQDLPARMPGEHRAGVATARACGHIDSRLESWSPIENGRQMRDGSASVAGGCARISSGGNENIPAGQPHV